MDVPGRPADRAGVPRTFATLSAVAVSAAAFAGAGFGGQPAPAGDPTGFAGSGVRSGAVHALWHEPAGQVGTLRRVPCAIATGDACYAARR